MAFPLVLDREELNIRLEQYLDQFYDLSKRRKSWYKQKLYSLEIEITSRCNRVCNYCYNKSSINPRTPQLNLANAKQLLQEAADYGIEQVAWLGGEPMMHNDLEGMLEYANELGIENILFTNGSLITEKNWIGIEKHLRRLVFHLDTIDPDVFMQINNIKQKTSLNLLAKSKDSINIIDPALLHKDTIFYVVLNRQTQSTLEETLHWAINDCGISTSALYPMVPVGRGMNLEDDMLSSTELFDCYTLRALIEQRPELMLLGSSEYCKQYQTTMAYIDISGMLSPYAGLPAIKEHNSINRLNSEIVQYYSELSFADGSHNDPSDRLTGACSECENRKFCFGTRTSAYNVYGDVTASDPFCWLGSRIDER